MLDVSDHDLLRENVRRFAERELAPKASLWDEREEFPWESIVKMAEVGLTGVRLPSQYGGAEADLVTTGIALGEVAKYDLNCAVVLCASNITGRVLLRASQSIRETWLPRIARGKAIVAFGATEPEAGSDIRASKATARRQEGSYVIKGEKSMVTFAGVAHGFVVLVRTRQGEGGMSCVFVEADRKGVSVQPLPSFGWRATKWGSITFDDVRVPTDNLIGEEGKALSMLHETVQEQRALTGIIALASAERSLEMAMEYAKIRKVFGKPLATFEGIQFRIVEDYSLVQATKLVCYKALQLIDKGAREASIWATMANLLGGEVAFKAVNNAMDVYGGLGYSTELPIERHLRDIKGIQLASATLKFDIARNILGEEFLPITR